MKRVRRPWMVPVGLLAWVVTAGTSAQPLPLGEPYRDDLNGVSLRPFEVGVQVQTKNDSDLARWVGQDASSGEMLWSLRLFLSEGPKRADLPKLAKAISLTLTSQPGTKVEKTARAKVGGAQAILLSGERRNRGGFAGTGMKSRSQDLVFRQAWVLRKPGEFMVIEWVKTQDSPGDMESSWLRLLGGVTLFDPSEAIEAKKRSIARAQKLLWEEVTPRRLHQAMPNKPRWFLNSQEGKPVGWLRMEGGPARRDQLAGYELWSWTYLKLPDQPILLMKQTLFSDPNLTVEFWRIHRQIGDGQNATVLIEEGARQGGLILTSSSRNQEQQSLQSDIPEPVKDIYLPKLLGRVLPRLVNPSRVGSYTFAEYARSRNDFNMRTFAVLGPATLRHDGRNVKTVKCADQPTARDKPTVLFIDADGALLRSTTPGGFVMEACDESRVLTIFPKANLIVQAMNRADRKDSGRPAPSPSP